MNRSKTITCESAVAVHTLIILNNKQGRGDTL